MATEGVLLKRDRVFGAKIETTTGTAIALLAADGAFGVMSDAKLEATILANERQQQGTLTAIKQIPGARMGKFTGRTEVYNASTTPLSFSVLLKACGFAVNTGVYTPTTGNVTTATLGLYEGRSTVSRFKSIIGAMGNVKLTANRGDPAYFEWDFTGKWVAPATVTRIAPTYDATSPPRTASITLTIGGTTYRAGKFELDMGNKVVMRQDVTDVTGYRAAYIVERAPRFKIGVESLGLGSKDWWADHLAGTTAALAITLGSGSNGQVSIAASALQLISPPTMDENDGILLDSLEFQATGTDDDELTITLA